MDASSLAHIEEMATLQFSIEEVAIITALGVADLRCGPGATAFMRGRLRAQAEVRAAILQAAKQGSTPAQKEFQKLATDSAIVADED